MLALLTKTYILCKFWFTRCFPKCFQPPWQDFACTSHLFCFAERWRLEKNLFFWENNKINNQLVILSLSNFHWASSEVKAQNAKAVCGISFKISVACQRDVTFSLESHPNSLRDPFVAIAPRFCIGSSPRAAHSLNKTSTSVGGRTRRPTLRMTYRGSSNIRINKQQTTNKTNYFNRKKFYHKYTSLEIKTGKGQKSWLTKRTKT